MPYSLKLSNQIVTFRFFNTPKDTDYQIIFSNKNARYTSKKNFLKADHIYYFDNRLNRWLAFKVQFLYHHLNRPLELILQDGSYIKLEHALSNSEKELLALGKDVTVSFGHFNQNHIKTGSITKNITADYSYFLGSNSLFLNIMEEKKILKHSLNNQDNY